MEPNLENIKHRREVSKMENEGHYFCGRFCKLCEENDPMLQFTFLSYEKKMEADKWKNGICLDCINDLGGHFNTISNMIQNFVSKESFNGFDMEWLQEMFRRQKFLDSKKHPETEEEKKWFEQGRNETKLNQQSK